MWGLMGISSISVKSHLTGRRVLGDWLTQGGYFGRLWPPLIAALYLTLCIQVLPTTPRGSHLLCCLPPTELTHKELVFFNSLARIFLRMFFLCHE